MTPPLHRHQLLRLTSDGWAHALRCASDDDARRCLALWAARDHPLVVTRQSHAPDGRVAVGLPAPAMFGRRRLALAVEPSHVASFDAFPRGDAVDELLAPGTRAAWPSLLDALAAAGCVPRVYGGHGWQLVTGLDYLHAGSDLDLLLPVPDAASADVVCAALQRSPIANPRLDGELLFSERVRSCFRLAAEKSATGSGLVSCFTSERHEARPDPPVDVVDRSRKQDLTLLGGDAIAWREWLGWREGRTGRVLVKRLREVALIDPSARATC